MKATLKQVVQKSARLEFKVYKAIWRARRLICSGRKLTAKKARRVEVWRKAQDYWRARAIREFTKQ